MRSRQPFNPSASSFAYSFGPGPVTPVIKALIIANVAAFVVTSLFKSVEAWLGLSPESVFGSLWIWQPVTYMFLHHDIFHILFNMLALWMFGVELERMWGSRFFLKYYGVCGLGAAVTTLVVALVPLTTFDYLYALTDRRRLRRHLRHSAGLRALLPEPADRDVLRLSSAGEVRGDDHGRHRVVLLGKWPRRHRTFRAPGRTDRGVPLSQGWPDAPDIRDSVPLLEMADQPVAQALRRVFRRPGRRRQSASALSSTPGGYEAAPQSRTPQPSLFVSD